MALFENPRVVDDFDIKIVPLDITLEGRTYMSGGGLSTEEVIQRMRHSNSPPSLTAPGVTAFEEVYQELARSTDQICVLVHSQKFTDTYANAQTARSKLLGRCDIMVIDSRTTSAALGYLVESAARSASEGNSLDEVIHTVRGVIPRLYSVMYVNSLGFIQKAGLIGETQAILGTMLDIKPLLTIEDGLLITMEKARTHTQAIDKMVEFVSEFTNIERLCIIQSTLRASEHTRALQDRLALEFNFLNAPIIVYEPLTASYIGPDGLGMVIMENDSF